MDAVSAIEREYPYRPGWAIILFGGGFFGFCAAIGAWIAIVNDRGLKINQVIEFSPSGATVFYWVGTAVMLACMAGFAVLARQRLTCRQRVALTATSIIVPRSRWSTAEQEVKYARISALALTEAHGQRFLRVEHTDGSFVVAAGMLPSKQAFEEIAAHVQAGVTRAREEHDRLRRLRKDGPLPREGR